MRIVSVDHVDYLRSHPFDSSRFPSPFWVTDAQLEAVEYITELWWSDDGEPIHTTDDERIVVTFDEIAELYASTPEDLNEWHSPHAFLRDCIDNGFHPCLVHD